MTRINFRREDGGPTWFDDEKSEQWANGSQTLYRTTGSRWILRTALIDGDQYRYATPDEARDWLTASNLAPEWERLGSQPHRPMGRPEIGGLIRVRLGSLLPALDNLAASRSESRAETIRHLIWLGLREPETSNDSTR
jgi:hypothetical protein